MRVFDCFTFNDELDLLELRFMELDPVVDVFVICELQVTFTRKAKPLHFYENSERFHRWIHKIRLLTPPQHPTGPHPEIEIFQRRYLAAGVRDAMPDDVVLMGDVDEIPSRSVVFGLRRFGCEFPSTTVQRLYYYCVNMQNPGAWAGTVAMPRRGQNWPPDFQDVRNKRGTFPMLPDSGWHFSWLGGADQVSKKLGDIDVAADAALCGSKDIVVPAAEDVPEIVAGGRDLFGRDMPKMVVPIEPAVRQPCVIREWLLKHPEYEAKEVAA